MANTSYRGAFSVWRADILEVISDEISYEVVVLRSMDGISCKIRKMMRVSPMEDNPYVKRMSLEWLRIHTVLSALGYLKGEDDV